jgi:hypothetical protein
VYFIQKYKNENGLHIYIANGKEINKRRHSQRQQSGGKDIESVFEVLANISVLISGRDVQRLCKMLNVRCSNAAVTFPSGSSA